MFTDVLTGTSILSILMTVVMMVSILWFIFAIGLPLQEWLKRELGSRSDHIAR